LKHGFDQVVRVPFGNSGCIKNLQEVLPQLERLIGRVNYRDLLKDPEMRDALEV